MKQNIVRLVDDNYFELEGNKDKDSLVRLEEAEKFLRDLGIEYEVKSKSHIKIKYVNYYPSTGSVNLDGSKKFVGRRLNFLENVLRRERIL